MARHREVPKCPYCGAVIAKAVHQKQKGGSTFVGDTFIYWQNIPHSCEGKKKALTEWKEQMKNLPPLNFPFAKNESNAKVVHCKKEPFDVYIGRPSKWGNPFTHKVGTKAEFILPTREEAVEAYRKWITEGDGKHLLADLHELKGKVLGCWCKPKSCHGDVLIELLNKNI